MGGSSANKFGAFAERGRTITMGGKGQYNNMPLGSYNQPATTGNTNQLSYTKFSNLINRIFEGFVSKLGLIESFATFHVLEKKSSHPNKNVSKLMSFTGLVAGLLKKSPHPAIKIFGSMLLFGTKHFPNGKTDVIYDFKSPHSRLPYFISETKDELSKYKEEILNNFEKEFKKARGDKNHSQYLISLYNDLKNAFFFEPKKNSKFDGVHNALDEFALIVFFEWIKTMSSNKYRPFILLEKSTWQGKDILPILKFINVPESIILFLKNQCKDLLLLAFTDYAKFAQFFEFNGDTSKLLPIYYSWGGKNSPRLIGEKLFDKIAFLADPPPKNTKIILKFNQSYFFGGTPTWTITHSEGSNVFIYFRNDLLSHYSATGLSSAEEAEWSSFNPVSLGYVEVNYNSSPNTFDQLRPQLSSPFYNVLHHIRDFEFRTQKISQDLSQLDKHFHL